MKLTKRKQRALFYSLAILLLSLLGLNVNQQGSPGLPDIKRLNQPGFYNVTQVFDGDTIEVEIAGKRESIRMLGVDTPETHDPRKPVQCFGQAASEYTKSLVEGKTVRLEADPTDSDRDKYYRLLRYVYMEDGRLLNAELIRNGYGFAYTVFPISKLDEFRALEAEARESNKGLWAGCKINETQRVKQTSSQP